MRIAFSKELPTIKELVEILKSRFPDTYTVKKGLDHSSILIGKSTLIGAELSVHGNEVSLSSSPPSVFGGLLMTLGMTELAIFLFPFLFKEVSAGNYRELEQEIGTFLTLEFGQ